MILCVFTFGVSNVLTGFLNILLMIIEEEGSAVDVIVYFFSGFFMVVNLGVSIFTGHLIILHCYLKYKGITTFQYIIGKRDRKAKKLNDEIMKQRQK